MAVSQSFTYGYSVTFGTNGAISVSPSNPKGPLTVTDDGTADTARLGDIANDGVSVTGLNNKTSTYYGTAVIDGKYGIILADQNGKWVFLTDALFTGTAAISGSATQNGTWTLAGTGVPTAPTGLVLASDTGASSTDQITSVATINGVAAAGSTVTLKVGATTIGTGTADASGNFSITPTSGLVQGANTIAVTSTTSGGTSASSSINFTYDTGTPAAPTIGGVADNAGAVQGNLINNGVTDDTTLTVSGTAEAGATVNVYNNGTLVGTTTAGGGNWSLTTSALSGSVSLTARTTDAAGNQGTASTAFNTTVDTTAPAVTSIAASGAGVTAGSGSLNAGKTVTFTVNASEALTVTGMPTLTLSNGATATYTGGSGSSALTFSYTVAAGDGNTSDLTVTALNTPSGAAVRDAAGNAVTFNAAGVGNPAGTLAIDTVAPGTPTIGSVSDNTGSVQGPLSNGGTTDDTTLTVSGTAEAGATVNVYNGATLVGTATATGGTWSLTTAALPDGAASLTARTTDAAGNQGAASAASAASAAFAATVDATSPAVTSIATSGAGIAGGSGSLNAGKTVTFTVNASEALTVSGTPTLTLSNGATATYTGGGGSNALTFSYTVAAGQDAADLAVTALNGTVRNAAGNAVAFNAGAVGNPAGTLAIDTTAPTATTTIGLAQDTGAAGDGTSSNPALTGTVSTGEAGVTVTIRDGGTVIGTATTGDGGVWTFANADATEAAHSYTASVTDAAGNAGGSAATSPATTTVDKVADGNVAVDLTDASAAAGGASVQFDLSGLDAGSTASVTFTGSGGGTVTRSYTADGTQSADVSGLQGDVTATVLVSDRAGNTAAGAGDALAADPVCFMPGTLVATPSGERAVETLRAGDLVLTACGRAAPVRWLGRQTVSTRFADPLRVLPVRIAAGALGESLPRRDLLVSADHALLVDGVLVRAGALVDGAAIRREAGVPEVFTYWHVELADHALVLAEGVPAETFVDNVARLAFDNWDEHEAAGSEAPVAEMALPRAKSRRQVPAGTRRRLAERAALLLGGRTAAA